VSLVVTCISYGQEGIRFCFLIYSDKLCLLIGKLSPFTSRVIIEKYLLIPVFLLLFSPGQVLCLLFYIFSTVLLQVLLVYWTSHASYFPSSCSFIISPWVLFFLDLSYLWLFLFVFCVNYSFEYLFNVRLVDINHFSLFLVFLVSSYSF
jgi:hypothetical protein